WAGANSPGFAPDVTSYDYDAPINEYGLATPKFWELRKMMQKYSDKKLPNVPKAPMPIITVPKFELTEFAPFYRNQHLIPSVNPQTFEEMNLGWGMTYYTTVLPEVPVQSMLTLEAHDYAQVFIDDVYIGKIDRVKNEKSLTLPPVKKGQKLAILVEAMGRINFGRAIKDFKGIVGDVVLNSEADEYGNEAAWTLKKWTMTPISDDYNKAVKAFDANKLERPLSDGFSKRENGRGYYRGYFNLKKVGDTFLNFETWGKGQVYVNGHAMGRIWSIGPQQTLYVPGCWLKKGQNEIIVLDIVGPKEAVVWGQAEPELNKLQLEQSNKHNNIGDKPDLNSATPISVSGGPAAGVASFKPGNGWQTIQFDKPAKGRYVAIEMLSTHQPNDRAAIAELYLQGVDGKRLSREPWRVKYASTENENGNHLADKVFDLQESTFWQTERGTEAPYLLVIDLGSEQTVKALEYLPRAEQGAPGSVKNFKIYLY
ncbi:MAG: discoidin domain-containing protein, partial [Prevotella sp.]